MPWDLVARAFFLEISFYDTCLAMLGFIWSKAASLPECKQRLFQIVRQDGKEKSVPTGLATTYRGAYASEHAGETMRKAVLPGESTHPKERKKRNTRCVAFVNIL